MKDIMQTPHAEEDYLPPLLQDIAMLDSVATLERLNAAADQHPHDARPLLLIAAEYAQAKAYDQAEAAFIGALRRDPDFAVARFQLGLLQLTSGRPAAASATWAPLSELPEDNEFRLFKTGLDALAQDRFAEAAQWLRAGIAANHSNPALNRDMQRFLAEIARIEGSPPDDGGQPDATAEQASGEHFLVSAYRNLH